jgi:hypothetical protein
VGSDWLHVCRLLLCVTCIINVRVCTKKDDVGIDVFHFGLRVLGLVGYPLPP